MAKKRKTRAQKEKAAARRQPVRDVSGEDTRDSALANSATTTPRETTEASPRSVDTAQVNNSEDLQRHRQRMRTMRLSLMFFAALAVVQTTVWLLEFSGLIRLDFISL